MLARMTSRIVAFTLLAGLTAAPALAQRDTSGQAMKADKMMSKMGGRIPLMTKPTAQAAGLQGATGFANVDVKKGTVDFTVMLAEGSKLPAGAVLEGWLSTAGRKGGPGKSTASEADQKYGPAFGMKDLAVISRDLPYALSTGVLKRQGDGRTYEGRFKIDNELTPYSAVAVTIESDGNKGRYDPRPGTPLMDGMIGGGMMKEDGSMMKDDKMESNSR